MTDLDVTMKVWVQQLVKMSIFSFLSDHFCGCPHLIRTIKLVISNNLFPESEIATRLDLQYSQGLCMLGVSKILFVEVLDYPCLILHDLSHCFIV